MYQAWIVANKPDLVKDGLKFIVFFDPTFIEVLINDFGIKGEDIIFIADREFEGEVIKGLYLNTRYVIFSKEKLYNNLGQGIFSQSFLEELQVPKTDKLVILGNPPYQEMSGEVQAKPIYHKFIEACINLNPNYFSFIVPSRWMKGGMGLASFREKMKKDKRFKIIRHFPEANKIFPGTEINGGLNYFLWQNNYNGACDFNGIKRDLDSYDSIVTNNDALSIIEKTKNYKTLINKVSPIGVFGIPTNFSNWRKTGIKCLFKGGNFNFISRDNFQDNLNIINKYKICVSKAKPGAPNEIFTNVIGRYFLLGPQEVCSHTYLILNYFDSRLEAENFASYISTKFFRFLLNEGLASQDISKDKFLFVPDLEDYSHTWTDEILIEKFGLTEQEWNHIDSKIRDWKK